MKCDFAARMLAAAGGALLTVAAFAGAPFSAVADELPSGQHVYSMAINAMHDVAMPKYTTYDLSYVDHGIELTLYCAPDGSHRFLGSGVSMAKNDKSNKGSVFYNSDNALGILTFKGKVVMECTPFPFAPELRAFRPSAGSSAGPVATVPTAAPTDAPLDMIKSIGSARAFSSKSYSIENLGIERIAGNSSYHLKMTALDDQSVHPITDLYVDTASHLVRSVVLGGGKRGFIEGGGGFAQFDLGPVREYWLVRQIHIEASGHMLFMHAGGTLEYTLDNFAFPSKPVSPGGAVR